MAVFMKWFGPERLAEIQTEQRKRMERAVRVVSNEVKKSLGVKFPPASSPGNPPHLRTGELRRSIATEVVDEGGKIVGRVGTNKTYAKYLELPNYLNRPFLLPAVARMRNTVERILSQKMG